MCDICDAKMLEQIETKSLIAALGKRGYVSRPKDGWAGITPQPDRNTALEEEWLAVWRILTSDRRVKQESTWDAVVGLYRLLEPPSVRERRLNSE